MWKQININKQQIIANCDNAVLIKMPHNSDYDNYSFWHPTKLIKDGKNKNAHVVLYTDEFLFHLIKYGKGKWNKRQVLDRITIKAYEFETAFETINKNIIMPKKENNESYLIVEEHKKLIVKNIEVIEC